MKIQVSNTNAPSWRDVTVNAELPLKAAPLATLAKTSGGYGTVKPNRSSATSIPTSGVRPEKIP